MNLSFLEYQTNLSQVKGGPEPSILDDLWFGMSYPDISTLKLRFGTDKMQAELKYL